MYNLQDMYLVADSESKKIYNVLLNGTTNNIDIACYNFVNAEFILDVVKKEFNNKNAEIITVAYALINGYKLQPHKK
jgi:hypothetical protein